MKRPNKLGLVAILPMKAHSERVSGKNFRNIAGKPLFRWILDTLLSCPDIDKVVINTDATEILRDNGLFHGSANGRVIIRDRKPSLVGDMVSMNLIIKDDIKAVAADAYFMTHTTNPLLKLKTIQALYQAYKDACAKGHDSLFTVNHLQTRFYTPEGLPINHDPQNLLRTQDLPVYCEENSVGYLFSRDSFYKTNARIGVNPILAETPMLESVDIDEPSDWTMAESLLLNPNHM
ncbi:acylneuraminate cytidylyltransferase family protein [Hellea sp.]|nr:acylneuraminate cytidylyltransferase family protein [Hellea sp.]MDC1088177.1 acylneuraminate cytidylyltransferase family protein [Hellea sp.]